MKYNNSIPILAIALALFVSSAHSEGQCALHLQGESHVGLSASARPFDNILDRSQYSFQLWFTPSRFVAREQNLLQTGIVRDDNGLWAVEISFRTTVWARSEAKPSVTAVSVDVWSHSAGEWTKTRYNTVLGGEVFPWVHISFHAGSNFIAVNGDKKRTDKLVPRISDESPRSNFALGEGLHGMIEDVRIWAGPTDSSNIHATLCSETTKQLALYVPFNDCERDTISAYSYNKPVCLFINGFYEWAKSYPVEYSMCPLEARNDPCTGAERIVAPEQDSYEVGMLSDIMLKALPVAGILGVLACAVLVSIYRYKRNARRYSSVPQLV